MKIVVVNCTGETYTEMSSGAVATWVRALTAELAGAGHDAVALAKRTDARVDLAGANYLDYPEVPRVRGSARASHLWRRFRGYHHLRQPTWQRRVYRYLERIAADAVVLHNDPEMAGWLAPRLSNVPVIHLFHNENFVARQHRRSYRRAGVTSFAVSRFTARWTEEHIGLPVGSVGVLNPGIDVKRFAPDAGRECGSVPRVIFVGLLNENKSPHTLLDAADLLRSAGTTVAVTIAGSARYGGSELTTTYEHGLLERAKKLRQRGVEVTFLGYVGRDQLPQVLANADIGVVTSRRKESFGLVALEMLAAGLPIVVAETGGLPEVAGEAGRRFSPGDPASLADQLRLTIDDCNDRSGVGERSRDRAAGFTWSAAADTVAAAAAAAAGSRTRNKTALVRNRHTPE